MAITTGVNNQFKSEVMLAEHSHSSKSVIAVYDFGGEKSATNGEFKLVVPAATSASAVIRLN